MGSERGRNKSICRAEMGGKRNEAMARTIRFWGAGRLIRRRESSSAMSLIELLVVVSILALLAVCLAPAVGHSLRQRENLNAATQLRAALSAFEMYAAEQGRYPAGQLPGQLPPEMAGYYFPYYKIDWWNRPSPLGGAWEWCASPPDAYSISICAPERSNKQLAALDAMLDDGDLSAGRFRRRAGACHFIVKESE